MDRILPPLIAELTKKLSAALEQVEALMQQIQDLGYPVKLVERLELPDLWHCLKRHEYILQHVSPKTFSEPRRKVRIYLPLLCIYVQQVTGEPHYADLTKLLRSLFVAEGFERKEHLTEDAVRHRHDRYRDEHSEQYLQLQRATKTFLVSPRPEDKDATTLLLMLAYLETGITSPPVKRKRTKQL